jgi:hypothetical protein
MAAFARGTPKPDSNSSCPTAIGGGGAGRATGHRSANSASDLRARPVNIDVPDLATAIAFYGDAFGLTETRV